MKFTTAISKIENDREIIRGTPLEELVKTKTFLENTMFVLRGVLPTAGELVVLNAILSAAIDHGVGAPSTTVARIAASTGNSLHTTLATGILTMGDLHGSAIEGAAKFFHEHAIHNVKEVVATCKKQSIRIPGFGHRVLAKDHRATLLLTIAREQEVYGSACTLAEEIEKELSAVSSKPLPLNIDGAMAAILSDMGFKPEVMKGLFILARLPGLIAHSVEQAQSGEGLKRLAPEEEIYTGK
jgi:citryl-CoA lyase